MYIHLESLHDLLTTSGQDPVFEILMLVIKMMLLLRIGANAVSRTQQTREVPLIARLSNLSVFAIFAPNLHEKHVFWWAQAQGEVAPCPL
jgi:hypothetical protein